LANKLAGDGNRSPPGKSSVSVGKKLLTAEDAEIDAEIREKIKTFADNGDDSQSTQRKSL